MPRTTFVECKLEEIEFIETDLSNSEFTHCTLSRSVFENSVLEAADFRNAFNFSVDPNINKMKGAKFSSHGLSGLLDKYEIEIE